MVRDIHITDRYCSLHLNLLPSATKLSRTHISAKAQQPPLTRSSIIQLQKLDINTTYLNPLNPLNPLKIKIQVLFPEKLRKSQKNISHITESMEKNSVSVPLLGSTPKVNEVYSGLRPILHPRNVEPHSIFLVYILLTNQQTWAKAWTFFKEDLVDLWLTSF